MPALSSPSVAAAPLSTRAAHALMHLTVFLWGFTAIFGRLITLDALSLVFYRLVLVVLVMPLVIRWRGLSMRVTGAELGRFAGVGTLVALHWLLFYGCIKYAGVAVAVLCLSTVTFFTACFEPLVFKRKPSFSELGIGFGVMVGVSFLVKLEGNSDFLGLALGLGSALFSAIFGTFNGQLARRHRGEVLTFFELSAALLFTGLVFVAQPHRFVPPWTISLTDALLLVFFALAATVLPWLTSLKVLQTVPPYTLALAVSLEPVYAMVLAFFFFPGTEQLTWKFYAGGAVLIALVAMNTWRRRS